jgi:hypothetical protein
LSNKKESSICKCSDIVSDHQVVEGELHLQASSEF